MSEAADEMRVRVSDGEAESPLAESMTLTLANRAPRFAGLPAITKWERFGRPEAQVPTAIALRVRAAPGGDAITGRCLRRADAGSIRRGGVAVQRRERRRGSGGDARADAPPAAKSAGKADGA
jgi:hypothetical protein